MILSFKEQFVEKIVNKQKLTTIREDKTNRWKVRMTIHFWKGSPYNQKSYHFATSVVKDIMKIKIINKEVFIDGDKITITDFFLKQEGFDNKEQFFDFFKNKDFEGKIIFWSLNKENFTHFFLFDFYQK